MAVRTRERGYKGCVLGRFQEHEINKKVVSGIGKENEGSIERKIYTWQRRRGC